MRGLVIGIALLLGLASLAPRPGDLPAAPAALRTVAAPPVAPPNATIGNGYGELVIPRSPDGHFYLDAQVNGATVRFLVDTGATTIALRRDDAQAAGLATDPAAFTAVAHSAGGAIAVAPITLDRVAMGSFEATRVPAAIVAADLPVSLLGRSWLGRVGSVTITGDRMTLR